MELKIENGQLAFYADSFNDIEMLAELWKLLHKNQVKFGSLSAHNRTQSVKLPLIPKEPVHVGTWVVMAPYLTKYGLDGDSEFPYPPDDREALEQAKYLYDSDRSSEIYLLHVFNNGQMRTFEYDGSTTLATLGR